MVYPNDWEKVFIAKNGKTINFRPEKVTDTDMLWKMFSTLSEITVSNLIPPFTRERIESWTSNIDYNEVLAIVAVTEEENIQRIVGSASLKFNSQKVFKHKAELGIAVHDDYQKLGIGTALLNHLLAIAKMKKLKKVGLIVNIKNERAIYMYRKIGFEFEGTLHRELLYKGRYNNLYQMALFL
jgi:L-phenylalanine/L-methionine N-acetyltransferase